MAHQPVKPPARPPQRDEQRENEREANRDQRENEREAERRDKAKAKAKVTDADGDPVEPVETIGDEQRERSADIEAMGVEAWKAEHDERPAGEKQKTVQGVQTHGDAKTLEPGSSRR